ncbi:hypothetical protein P7K49_021142, partial [Saguinus oedipus]
ELQFTQPHQMEDVLQGPTKSSKLLPLVRSLGTEQQEACPQRSFCGLVVITPFVSAAGASSSVIVTVQPPCKAELFPFPSSPLLAERKASNSGVIEGLMSSLSTLGCTMERRSPVLARFTEFWGDGLSTVFN